MLLIRTITSEDPDAPNISTDGGHYEIRLVLPNKDVYNETLRWIAPNADFPYNLAEQFEVNYPGTRTLIAELVCSEPVVESDHALRAVSVINFTFNYNERPVRTLKEVEDAAYWATNYSKKTVAEKKNAIKLFSEVPFNNCWARIIAACELLENLEITKSDVIDLTYNGVDIQPTITDWYEKHQRVSILQFFGNLYEDFNDICISLDLDIENLPENWETDERLLKALTDKPAYASLGKLYKILGDKTLVAIEPLFSDVLAAGYTYFIFDW
jgi:hypothetical protein